jgi:signal transduction histidine kinase
MVARIRGRAHGRGVRRGVILVGEWLLTLWVHDRPAAACHAGRGARRSGGGPHDRIGSRREGPAEEEVPVSDQGRRLARSAVAAVLDAVVGAPAAPAHGWPPPAGGWRRVLPVVVGAALAIGFGGGAIAQLIAEGVAADLATLLGVAQCAPLLLAVRSPLAAWRVMAVGLLGGVLALAGHGLPWPWPVTSSLALVLVLFLVAASYDRRVVVGVGLVTALGVILPARVAGMPLWLGLLLWGVASAVLAFGDALGGRRAAETRLAEQSALRRQDLARQAVLEERGRIARELHDVVAHHMSMIAIQAEAAPHKITDLSPEAERTLDAIRGAARQALAETRRVVGLLRDDGDAPERVPRPGLDQLDDLVARARQSGLRVEPIVVGVPRPLAAGVDLSAYRIVQEALSNAARYAPGARVGVEVRYGDDRLHVAVADDGGGGGPVARPGGGHGLVGMRERVGMLGGTLAAGPRAEGGFAVVTELPYGEVAGAGPGVAS